ncbi:MAG: S8 family serine peptidase, partial [Planctomycetes bacterium]|nr:S8 family serine peptidase [Planctomycetota bacterium]
MSFHASLRGDEAGPKLRLDGTALDPRRGLPLAPLHRLLDGPAGAFPDEPSLHLIQLAGPVRDSWIAALRAAGIDVLQYAPEDAYLVFEPPSAIARARGLPFVRWAGPFPPSLRLAPALREIAATARGSVPPGKASLDVIVQLFDTGDLRALENWLAAAGGTAVSTARLGRRIHLRAQVPPELLAPVARWPSVYRVEPFPRLELYGERAAAASTGAFPAEATCVEPGYEAWLARKGVRGEGMIVQVMDDGIERGDASGLPGTAHPDLLGAIAGVANATSDAEADSRAGHGSFNAGLIAGRAATGAADAAGFLLGLGVAPASGVFGTKIFNNLGRFEIIPRTFPDLVAEASRRGAAISSNSWGASVFGEYDALAAEFDFLARDASPDPGEQPMTFVFAAGNEGDDVEGGAQSIGSPATAKNVVSVGASEGCGGEGRDGCGTGADGADSIRDVADFSSRGPQADGRLGPTLVAPGTHIAGVASTAVGYDGSGLCDALWPPGQVLYARGSGTSHSCPLVAGAAALFHQHRLAKTAEAPSPALVRAAIASTAVDLAGGADGLGRTLSSVPGDVQGWGRLAMEDLIPDTNAVPRALFFDQATLLGDTGDAWEVIVFPLDRARPLRIALAWSDAPALPGASPVLVNDLDLEVESGELYLGNRFDGGFSAPGGEPDRLNNLERVALKEPAPVIKVRVRAAHIRGDGAPAGDATDQDFALVVQGGTLQSSRGVVGLRRGKYACDSIVAIDVSDLDLKGKGAVQVTVESTAAAEPVAVALTEVNPGTGVFDGTVLLGKDPGELFVQDGSTITARYADADDGTGSPAASTAVAGVDCVAPEITEVRVEELTDSSAVVRWTTSEEATGKVHAGTECAALQIEASAPRRSRTHAVTLAGLPAGTRHHFTVAATDLVGNTRADDHGGACYSFHTSALVCGFQDDVEPEPVEGWTHRSEQGPDDWAAVTFRGARSPTQAWHAAGFDGFKDSFLITPALEVAEGDRFSFWHTFQLEKGYDGAVLEISANDGATWSDLGPHIVRGGYVEVVSGSPLGDRMAWTGSRTEPMSLVEVDLSAWAGPARRIRFRIATDSSFVEGFGWYVDDIAVCRALNKRARVSVDRSVYRCGDGARDRDDDLDLAGAGSAAVLVSSTSRPEPLTLAAAERPPGSGVLLAEVLLADVEGGIQVAHGDEVLVSYEDADDGTGAGPVQAAARATVDCAAPAISGVRIVELLDDEATIAWETDEPALTEIAVGPDCAAPATRVPLPVGGTSHVAVLGDLTADATYRFVITARDEAGNVAVDDAGGVCRAFRPTALCSERYDFDAGAPGWTHAASLGADAWRLEETPVARTPPAAWFLPGEDQFSDASLVSPVFLVPPGSYLAFWHAFDFEEGFDGAVLEVSGDGGATWTDLGPQVRRGG